MKQIRANKKLVKVATKALAFVIFFSSIPALSAISYRNAFEQMDIINHETKELNLSFLARIQIIIDQNQFNMSHYIPYASLPDHSQGSEVAKKVFQQTLKTLMNSEAAQNSTFVKGANDVQSAMSAEVGSVQHKVSIGLDAIETTAQIKYKGVVNAEISYDISNQDAAIELTKQVGNQVYAYTHVETSTDRSDKLGVRWSF